MPAEPVRLSTAIELLREELTAAANAGAGSDIVFALGPIELTLEVAITRAANGKFGWSILGIGASKQAELTQTLRLQLVPATLLADGTYSNDFRVAGVVAERPSFGVPDPPS